MGDHVAPAPLDQERVLEDALYTATAMVGVVRDQLEGVGDFGENLCNKVMYPIHLRKERARTPYELYVWICRAHDDEFLYVFQARWMVLYVGPLVHTHVTFFHEIFPSLHDIKV